MPSLLASERVARALDDEALAEYFTLGYIPAPSTALRDVWKLPPGHLLIWSASGGVRTERYWRPPPVTAGPRLPDSDVRAALRRQLDESVRAHLVSDVPVGAFLSGGIDSGAVVALMAGASRRPVRTFTAGFRDRAHDERRLARLVADRYGTDHNELVIEPESFDILPELVRHLGEPFADSSALPMFFISRLARRYVKVALSGDGGDELFLGYTYFRGVDLAYRLRPAAKALRALVAAAPSSLPPPASPALNDRLAAWRKRAADSLLAPFDAYRSKSTLVGLAAVGEALTPAFRARLADGRPYRALDAALQRPGAAGWSHPLEPVVRAAQTVSLPGDMLVKVDRMSMANSLEVRVPFVDHVLAEYVATIPIGQRFPRWRLKGLLKDSVADLLPEEVLRRPKHGFTAPLSSWVRGDIGGYAAGVLLDGRARARGLYEPAGVVALLRRHRERGGGLGAALWALLVFEMWCQVVLD
ncbi:MAG: asparagine synthase C-terminal domain-containing protein [Dehalococcoidia bacterium]